MNEQGGSYFIINTLSDKLKKAFEFGMFNFFHQKNKLVGPLLSDYNEIECYESTTKDGYGFYRGLKRIDIKDIPIIINIKKSYRVISRLWMIHYFNFVDFRNSYKLQQCSNFTYEIFQPKHCQ